MENRNQGCVHLVGAGPGDPDLITVKGRRLIENCDALVYDALVNHEMLEWTALDCEHYFVGKRSGNHTLPQIEIQALLLRLAKEGKKVVRLKGGDPFVFGRGGEEIFSLKQQGVNCEVVPGLTAGLVSGSAMGIPLTHRDYNTSLTFLSGHSNRDGQLSEDFRAFARTGATLCIYMGIGNVSLIQVQLLEGGLPETTPVAVIQWVSRADERRIFTSLKTLAEDIHREGITAPAIMIVGEVVHLGKVLG